MVLHTPQPPTTGPCTVHWICFYLPPSPLNQEYGLWVTNHYLYHLQSQPPFPNVQQMISKQPWIRINIPKFKSSFSIDGFHNRMRILTINPFFKSSGPIWSSAESCVLELALLKLWWWKSPNICSSQYGSHKTHVATVYLKCGQWQMRIFNFS